MVPAIGAVEYVGACHVWNGNKGIFTANASKNPENIQQEYLSGTEAVAKSSYPKEFEKLAQAKMDNNMNKEPKRV